MQRMRDFWTFTLKWDASIKSFPSKGSGSYVPEEVGRLWELDGKADFKETVTSVQYEWCTMNSQRLWMTHWPVQVQARLHPWAETGKQKWYPTPHQKDTYNWDLLAKEKNCFLKWTGIGYINHILLKATFTDRSRWLATNKVKGIFVEFFLALICWDIFVLLVLYLCIFGSLVL